MNVTEDRAQERALIGLTIGHAAHDTWYGVAPILMAVLSAEMGLSNSEIGLFLLFYQIISSVVQPFFGRLSERIGGRTIGVAAILWTTVMYTAAALAPSKGLLAVCITLAGFGSGAWHPQGAATATIVGGRRFGATAAAIFFFGGTIGTAILGSLVGGYLIDSFGRQSLLVLTALSVTLALTVVRSMVPRHAVVQRKAAQSTTGSLREAGAGFWFLVVLLFLGVAFRSLSQQTLGTYIPKYEQDLGVSPATYGFLMSLFLFASAIGGVAGAYLADRIGLRRVLIGSMVLAALALFGFTNTTGVLSYTFLTLVGLMIAPSHTLFMIAGHKRFPQSVATISGVFLGFIFFSGAGGAWLVGLLADRVGLGTMLRLLPWPLLIAAALALISVPGSQPEPAVEPEEPAPAV